jgi:hypothetical protein
LSYRLVLPENFTAEQNAFVESFKESVNLISVQTDLVFGAKDINSRHFLSTDAYANLVALPRGVDVTDRFDCDMPCEGTAQFADHYVQEDMELLSNGDINKKKSILNVHEYGVGTNALVFDKYLMKHHPSQSILGIIYAAHKIEISNFFTVMPNYVLEFGIGCSIESVTGTLDAGSVKLTEYEHEICFLMTMNWDSKQISCFMNKYRPTSSVRGPDTIYKCRNRICDKLNCNPSELRELLVGIGIHRKMPSSFFNRLIGSMPL